MEQVVPQLQQELFTLRAQTAAESGLADAVPAINNLATAQVRKDTPSPIDVKGLGRPKEFSGREEDFQRAELLEIQIHDRWTRVEVRWIQPL